VHPDFYDFPKAADMKCLDFRAKTYHLHIKGALHSKMVLIDGKVTIMGSKNFDSDTGMEYTIALEGSVTMAMRQDFASVWGETLPRLTDGGITAPCTGDIPILYLGRVEGKIIGAHNEHAAQDAGWLAALESAKKEVYIQTPNFNSKVVEDKLIETLKRGVKVTIVSSYKAGDAVEPLDRESVGTNEDTIDKIRKSLSQDDATQERLKFCWFIGKRLGDNPRPKKEEWSHVKAMIVDKEFAIVGSGNQDPQSWYHSRENNVLLDDPTTAVAVYKELLRQQQSLKFCFNA